MHTFTEKVGIVNQVLSYMQNADNQAALTAKNFDVTPHIARLQGEINTVTDLAPKQKALEVQHIQMTSDLQNASYTAYNDASGVMDAMMGLEPPPPASSKPFAAACAGMTIPVHPRPRRRHPPRRLRQNSKLLILN